jgi:hypothetical protein
MPAGWAQTTPSPPETTLEETYHFVVFYPGYRFVSTSGFPGRVAEYDSLNQSIGGDLTLTLVSPSRRYSWKYRAQWVSGDEYDMTSRFRAGKTFTLDVDARSFVRHLDNAPFGVNLSDQDIVRTDTIPDQALFGVKRTMNRVQARLKIPKSPVTVYARGGWQDRRGLTQMQWYDMGGDASCGSCHSASQLRSVNYTTRNIAGGVELKIKHWLVNFEHEHRSFNDRLQNPVDLYGSTLGAAEPLPPGVADTVMGNYAHNVLPSNESDFDTLRIRAPLSPKLVFHGDVSNGRTRNSFSSIARNSFGANLALDWNPHKRVRTMLAFHQQNTVNDFVPFYSLFGNPSLHRYWIEARVDVSLSSSMDLETQYTRKNITRSNALLWPQLYSPENLDLLQVVPATFSNTARFTLRFHPSERWTLRSGYEWVGTHHPGYLTDPGTAHRVFAGASLSPTRWLTFSDDFSVLLQSSFPAVPLLQPLADGRATFQRDNRLYLNTAYLTLKPVQAWSVGLGYGYYQNSLNSDLVYGTDPIYQEGLVPFRALSQSYSLFSTYLIKKRAAFELAASHMTSHSNFRPNLTDPNIPLCDAGYLIVPCSYSVAFAVTQSRVAVPQYNVSSTLDYRFRQGYNGGLRFQYGSYSDYVNPNLTGRLRSYALFFGRTW